jgi:hypothetical protein
MNDDPRIPPVDPITQLIADIDQRAAITPHIATLLVAEWNACTDQGMPPFAAAVLVGTRWAASS